jgi:hypothetical protein
LCSAKKIADGALAVAKGDAVGGVGAAVHFRGVKDDVRPMLFFGPKRDHFYPNVVSAGELGFSQLTNLDAPGSSPRRRVRRKTGCRFSAMPRSGR